ncbi:hypothetical protein GGX14DRAFT_517573 [Mycena pura]|uniref:Rho-GAP domain-containing protein n=1 Tax=Mycena pura TaxID=153505 RepID=A0AAD6VNB0_9AGAR|nr:hypothetical protein GGX14DRAFT_517573 [Mycena pura]
MGQNASKPSLAPSPSSQTSVYAVTSAGSKLKRAFAARRKRPQDVPVSGSSDPPAAKRGARQLTLQVAQAFGGKKPKDELSPVPPSPPPKPAALQAAVTKKRVPLPPLPPMPPATSDNRASIIPVTPGVSSAVNFIIRQERERDDEKRMESGNERYTKGVSEGVSEGVPDGDKSDSKEAWRRSDATITHRPGTSLVARASRPVSMAESLQSTHTVTPVNKRLSSVVTDADLAEEDEDHKQSSDHRHSTASVRSKPRSQSFNVGPSPVFNQTNVSPMSSPKLSSESAPPLTPSMSRETPTLTRAAANGIISPSSSGLQSTGNNIRGRLAAWTATNNSFQSASVPRPEHRPQVQSRQPALSMTSGFAPAAGLAKRAVEKMGRAWGGFGSGSNSSSSSSSTAPSSYASPDYGLVRTNSNNSGAAGKAPKHRRTPNSASSAWSVNSSNNSSSVSDLDAFAPPVGPILGKCLRGPLRVSSTGASVGGVVFGIRLRLVVRETAVSVRPDVERRNLDLPLLKLFEHRMLPALVVRCAQHLLIWGVQEEGLFRVTGRPSHISKLRNEFDSGADYDMSECTPGDLDPHAVASVFKAFLRELPEPILTQSLIPYFEAALAQESNLEQEKTPRLKAPTGPSLPSSPRSVQAMRKPPSLSTLAMPNMTARPLSQPLINALKTLIRQLPAENRDLLRTVTELIRETAKQSKETKMPLSNLLLVFCPSLNMNPPLLKVLCEAEGVWEDALNEPDVAVDAKRERESSGVLDIRAPDASKSVGNAEHVDDPLPSPTRSRSPGARSKRKHPAAVYVDYDESSSLSEVLAVQTHPPSDDVSSMSTSEDTSMDPRLDSSSPLLSSSAESLATPSSGPSLAHLPLEEKGFDVQSSSSLVIADSSDPADSPGPQFTRQPCRPIVSPPLGSPIQFPTISGNSPGTPVSSTRSIPTLSLPSLSSANFSPKVEHNSTGSAPPSPLHRLKKPSLHLLFSKRSASPLTPSPSGRPFISGPYLHPPRAASDSSLSTPVSAVTAPQGSSLTLPPLLDTPIESSSLRLALGIEDSPDTEEPSVEPVSEAEPPLPLPGQTPIADWYKNSLGSTHEVNHLRPHPTRKVSQASIASTMSNRLGILDTEQDEDWTQSVLLAADVDWREQGP